MKFEERVLGVANVKSLVWDGEALVDWVAGGNRILMNGAVQPAYWNYAYRFDAAVRSPSGRYVALYEKYGTKALVLDQGRINRELNRSFYQAHRYEYPITFLLLPDGTEAIAHCPGSYCRIDIEIAETGRRLTESVERSLRDVFHSRLVSSPSGTWLASAGWVWHPFRVGDVWSVEAALADPRVLDSRDSLSFDSEVESLVFLDDTRLAVSTGVEHLDDEPPENNLWLVDPVDGSEIQRSRLDSSAGSLVPFDSEHVLALFDHPRLLRIADGSVAYQWPHLDSGKQTSSIDCGIAIGTIPPFAKHPDLPMFALADSRTVTVVKLADGP